MRRSLIAVVAGFCLVAGTSADARPKHPSHTPAIHHDASVKKILVTTCIPDDPSCRENQSTMTVEVPSAAATGSLPSYRVASLDVAPPISAPPDNQIEEASIAPTWSTHGTMRGSYAWIHTKQGSSRVIAWARPRFQGFINEVERSGYRVGAPGCLSSGHMQHSKHHWGGACDLFVQVARNRTRLRLPPNHMAIALRYGLIDGCMWRNPDCGHFEVPVGQTVAQYMASRGYSGQRARRYASR